MMHRLRLTGVIVLVITLAAVALDKATEDQSAPASSGVEKSTGTQVGAEKTALAPPAASMPAAGESDCRRCHACDQPTPEARCLLACTRKETPRQPTPAPGQKVPDVVILNELEKVYLPVPFDHKGHAQMAEMGQGCVTCHHYTPEGRQHPACKACHDATVAGTDIRKPGLKGAYHRQCLNCHREWIDETACAICHMPKAGVVESGAAVVPTEYDILGYMHPPISQPDTQFYRARSGQAAETQVIFRHKEHVQRFGLNCVECHHEESCSRCHTVDRVEKRPQRSLTEHHRPCLRCHQKEMPEGVAQISGPCERCHWREDRPGIKPFDHADTGWPLSRYHQDKSCRGCHKEVPFTKASRECNACHSQWESGTFNHKVTGQELDETHAEIACADCHPQRQFDRPPQCDQCHDEKDGFVFPNKHPGPVVPKVPTSAPAGSP